MARKLAKLMVIILMAYWSAAVECGELNGTEPSGNDQLHLRKKRFLLFPVNANLLVSYKLYGQTLKRQKALKYNIILTVHYFRQQGHDFQRPWWILYHT